MRSGQYCSCMRHCDDPGGRTSETGWPSTAPDQPLPASVRVPRPTTVQRRSCRQHHGSTGPLPALLRLMDSATWPASASVSVSVAAGSHPSTWPGLRAPAIAPVTPGQACARATATDGTATPCRSRRWSRHPLGCPNSRPSHHHRWPGAGPDVRDLHTGRAERPRPQRRRGRHACSSVPGLVNSCSVPVMPRASGPDSSGKTSRAAGARHRVAVAPGIIRRHQRASSSTSITTAKVSSSTVVTTPNSSTREALSR